MKEEKKLLFPDNFIHVGLDDIDQWKMKTPCTIQNTKEWSGMLKLNNHCPGVIVTNGKLVGDRVENWAFEEVVVPHMPVGHTHVDVDQVFSIFAARLREKKAANFRDTF